MKEKKSTNQKAKESFLKHEEHSENIISNIPVALYRCLNDDNWTMLHISDTISRITGYPASDFINNHVRSFSSIIDQNDNKLISNSINKAIKKRTSFSIEYGITTKNGENRWLIEQGSAVFNEAGEFQYIDGSIFDNTEKKRIEESLKESEEKYRILIENQAEGISILDIDEFFLFSNPAADKIFGVKEGQLLNRNLKDFMSLEQFDKVQKETQKRITGKKSTYEAEITNAKGERKHLLISSSPYFDKNETYVGAYGIFRDITRLKQVEKKLSESENRYKTLTEITDEGIIIHENGKIIDVNPSTLRLFNTTEKYLIQKEIFEFIHPDYVDVVKQKIEEKYVGSYEIKIIKETGAIIPVEIKTKNYKIDKIDRRVISIRDITERKRQEAVLKKSEHELKIANTTKDKFLSIIAHDLRSPFNAIIGFSELLLDRIKDNDLSEIEKFSQLILHSANQSNTLLSNLLDWARAQSGNFNMTIESCHINSLINRVIDLLKINADSKHIQINSFIQDDIKIKADQQMLETVIRNLLSNAVKFTPSNGAVTLSTEIKNQKVHIAISDTGIGISTKALAQIWQVGSNYITTGTNKETGTGLGLVLCKEFVEKHKGKILVDSMPGKGSTFTVILPLS